MTFRPDPNSQSARARALGIPNSTLFYRETRAQERAIEARRTAVPAWIGVRIHPPIEPDHPLAAKSDPTPLADLSCLDRGGGR